MIYDCRCCFMKFVFYSSIFSLSLQSRRNDYLITYVTLWYGYCISFCKSHSSYEPQVVSTTGWSIVLNHVRTIVSWNDMGSYIITKISYDFRFISKHSLMVLYFINIVSAYICLFLLFTIYLWHCTLNSNASIFDFLKLC